jgi:urea-proton symporter
MTDIHGWFIIGGYFAFVWLLAYIVKTFLVTKDSFLVSNRNIQTLIASCSIASMWIMLPALFISAIKAYELGIDGLFWFLFPNTLILILFAYLAVRVRDELPNGYTFSAYMQQATSRRVQTLYLIEQLGIKVYGMAQQLLVVSTLFTLLFGGSYLLISIILAIGTLSYIIHSGFKFEITLDCFKLAFLYLILLPIVYWTIGATPFHLSFSGISGRFGNLFDMNGLQVFLTFGIPSCLILFSAPLGDQSFWQRTFSIKRENLKKSFFISSILFLIVPLSVGFLGFVAAGAGLTAVNIQFINIETVKTFLPSYIVFPFITILIAGVLSVLANNLTSVSSFFAHDFLLKKQATDKMAVKNGRLGMILTVICAIGVANIPGISFTTLWLSWGTLRAATMLPTLFTILSRHKYKESTVFYGIIVAWCLIPFYIYGSLTGNIPFILIGGALFLGSSGLPMILFGRTKESK